MIAQISLKNNPSSFIGLPSPFEQIWRGPNTYKLQAGAAREWCARGKAGGEMRMEARIIAVADLVEAMRSHRPSRPALDVSVAKDEIWSTRGAAYDPDVAGIL